MTIANFTANEVTALAGQLDEDIGPLLATKIDAIIDVVGGSGAGVFSTVVSPSITAGANGTAGQINIYPSTEDKGFLSIVTTANTGNTETSLTFAAQAAARTFTVPDPGGDAEFVMNYSQSISGAGAVALGARHVNISGGTGFAITLAAPSAPGIVKVIELSVISSGAVTMALTEVIGGSAGSSASFDAAGETLTLVSNSTKWVVLDEHGVTLS